MFNFQKIEATKLDYKATLEESKPRSWLKSVSAFANTHGGHILFGVTDDTHTAKGLDNPQQTASKISEFIASRITPAPRFELTAFYTEDGTRQCLDLVIQNGPNYPYYYSFERSREAYVRHGDRSELATGFELNNLILKGMNKTFDSMPSCYKQSDVSFTLLSATYKKETGEEIILPRDLISMRMLTEEDQVTNAGLLLCDQGFLTQSKVVCTRWKGTEKGSVDGDALDDQEFSDSSLISLLFNTEAFIRNNSKNAWTIRGMRREEKSDYPFKAVREVLVNAMIHRDYQIVGTEIHVDMFDNRLEITSPGGMLCGSRIQDMDLHRIPSMRRNEIISDLFGRLHYMDRRGSGIGRILNSYAEFNEQPEFFSTEYSFLVVLPNRSVAAPAQISISLEKTPLNTEKTPLTHNTVSSSAAAIGDDDCQLTQFTSLLYKHYSDIFRNKTIQNLVKLFKRYRYSYHFNRRNIADLLSISESAASRLLKKCIEQQIIQKIQTDEYAFIARPNQ